jgi:hypothetical protein
MPPKLDDGARLGNLRVSLAKKNPALVVYDDRWMGGGFGTDCKRHNFKLTRYHVPRTLERNI